MLHVIWYFWRSSRRGRWWAGILSLLLLHIPIETTKYNCFPISLYCFIVVWMHLLLMWVNQMANSCWVCDLAKPQILLSKLLPIQLSPIPYFFPLYLFFVGIHFLVPSQVVQLIGIFLYLALLKSVFFFQLLHILNDPFPTQVR